MAVSQSDIDALNAAIATGERSVTFADGRRVDYHGKADLILARNDLLAQKSAEEAAASGKARPRITNLYHAGRGFDR